MNPRHQFVRLRGYDAYDWSQRPSPSFQASQMCDIAAPWKMPNGQRAAREWIDTLSAKLPVDEDGTYVNGMERVGWRSVHRC
jgi:hypothetical protein